MQLQVGQPAVAAQPELQAGGGLAQRQLAVPAQPRAHQLDAGHRRRVGRQQVQRQRLQLQPRRHRQRLQPELAAGVDHRRARAGAAGAALAAQVGGELPAQRRGQPVAAPLQVLHAELQPLDLERDIVLGLQVAPAQAAVLELQRTEPQRPARRRRLDGGRRLRGRRRGCRRGRGQPVGQIQAPLRVALQPGARLLQPQPADLGLAGVQVDLARLDLQALQRRQRRCGGRGVGRAQLQRGQLAAFERDVQCRRVARLPAQPRLRRQPAVEPRFQHRAQIGREGLQPERVDLQGQIGRARIGLALDRQRAARRCGQRGLELQPRGLLHRPGQRAGLERQALEREAGGRLRRRVLPADAGVVQRQRLDADLPGRCGRGGGRGRGGGGGGRRRRTVRYRQPGKIQPPLRVARQVERQPVERDRAEGQAPHQRLHIAQRDVEVVPAQQRAAVAVGEGQRLRLHPAAQAHHRRRTDRGVEVELQLGADAPAQQSHRQRRRPVAQPRRQIELRQREARLRAAVRRKRPAPRLAVEARTIQHEGQPRRHLDLDLRGQRRQEGQRQRQLAELVDPAGRPVVEMHRAAAQAQVVQREACRALLGLRRGRRRGQPGDQVVDVVTALGGAGQAQRRRLDLQRRNHRRQPPQRGRVEIGPQPCDFQQRLGRWRAGRGADAQPLDRQIHRPGSDADPLERDRPPQRLAGLALDQRLQQRRQRQPGQQPQQQQAGQHDRGGTQQPGRAVRAGVLGDVDSHQRRRDRSSRGLQVGQRASRAARGPRS